MKILALTSNYGRGASSSSELRMIADSAMLKDGKPFYLPEFAPKFATRMSLAVRIDRLGKNIAAKFARRYYNCAAAALNTEAVGGDAHGSAAWSFDGAAVLGEFLPIEKFGETPAFTFMCGDDRRMWSSEKLCMSVDEVIAEVSRYFTLKTGDVIMAGLSEERFTLEIGQKITCVLSDTEVLTLNIK